MKIIHFSDTHLWLWLENTTREEDFYKNFEQVINDILLQKPDYVIHSGDLFHTSKPSNKAISVVISNFLKLSESGIKVIIIAWNHDTPRLSTTTHSFEIFKTFKWFYTFYEPEIKKLEFEGVNFVMLPHIHDENIFKDEFKKAPDFLEKDKINVFVSHFWISYKEYEEYTDEISWVNISVEELEILKKFDYVALGHYHKNFSLPWTNISYSGSLEHTSFNQKNYKVWYNILNFSDKLDKEIKYLQTRKMIDLWDFDCENILETEVLILELESKIDKSLIKDAIVKINFVNMNLKLLLDFRENLIYNFFKETFYFEYKKIKKQDENVKNNIDIKNSLNIINDNFKDFLANYPDIEKKDEIEKEISELLKAID